MSKAGEAIALLRSMVLSGESMSETAEAAIKAGLREVAEMQAALAAWRDFDEHYSGCFEGGQREACPTCEILVGAASELTGPKEAT